MSDGCVPGTFTTALLRWAVELVLSLPPLRRWSLGSNPAMTSRSTFFFWLYEDVNTTYVCMFVCVQVCMCACVYVRVYGCLVLLMFVMYVCMSVVMYVCMIVGMHACMNECRHMFLHVCKVVGTLHSSWISCFCIIKKSISLRIWVRSYVYDLYIQIHICMYMGWLRLVGSIKL